MSETGAKSSGITRRLTTILHADVAGYSRLMENDEVETLSILKEYKGLVAGFLDRHYGRVVNWTGDGLLAEFASVVESVQCAIEIQRELKARNDLLDEDRRMVFRVGINLGDVMVDNEELFGEGVNIAARLQGIAPVGGILISGTAFDQVRNKLSIEFDFMGLQSVKNIAEEIPAYTVVLDSTARATSKRVRKTADGSNELRARHDAGVIGAADPGVLSAADEALGMIAPGPYSGFWRRTVALAIDWGIVLIIALSFWDLTGNEEAMAFQPIIYVLYLGVAESSKWQASIGKKIMGIKVSDLYGNRLNIFRALGRNFAKLLSCITLLFGFAMAGWSERKQALHDKVSDCLLTNEDEHPKSATHPAL